MVRVTAHTSFFPFFNQKTSTIRRTTIRICLMPRNHLPCHTMTDTKPPTDFDFFFNHNSWKLCHVCSVLDMKKEVNIWLYCQTEAPDSIFILSLFCHSHLGFLANLYAANTQYFGNGVQFRVYFILSVQFAFVGLCLLRQACLVAKFAIILSGYNFQLQCNANFHCYILTYICSIVAWSIADTIELQHIGSPS